MGSQPVYLLVVPENEGWLLSIVAPLTSKVYTQGRLSIVVALWKPPEGATAAFLERFDPGRSLALAPNDYAAVTCGGRVGDP